MSKDVVKRANGGKRARVPRDPSRRLPTAIEATSLPSEPQASNAETLATLSQRVQRLRQQRGLSLEDLAGAADVSASFLSQLERGVGNPSFLTLTKIARALAVPIGYLFGEQPGASNGIVRGS